MTTTDFARKVISMVPSDKLDELLDLSSEVSRPLQIEIARHAKQMTKNSILAKLEVRDDKL